MPEAREIDESSESKRCGRDRSDAGKEVHGVVDEQRTAPTGPQQRCTRSGTLDREWIEATESGGPSEHAQRRGSKSLSTGRSIAARAGRTWRALAVLALSSGFFPDHPALFRLHFLSLPNSPKEHAKFPGQAFKQGGEDTRARRGRALGRGEAPAVSAGGVASARMLDTMFGKCASRALQLRQAPPQADQFTGSATLSQRRRQEISITTLPSSKRISSSPSRCALSSPGRRLTFLCAAV